MTNFSYSDPAYAERDALRARVAALEAALRDVCAAADGVQAGVAHLGGYVDNSVVAEVCAFFNGYAGGPDLDAAVAAALALLADA